MIKLSEKSWSGKICSIICGIEKMIKHSNSFFNKLNGFQQIKSPNVYFPAREKRRARKSFERFPRPCLHSAAVLPEFFNDRRCKFGGFCRAAKILRAHVALDENVHHCFFDAVGGVHFVEVPEH